MTKLKVTAGQFSFDGKLEVELFQVHALHL